MGSTSSLVQTPNDNSPGTPESNINKTTRTNLLALSRAHNKFALSLYHEFSKDAKRPGNFMFAPITLSTGLGMLYLGAKESTKAEMYKTFYLNEVTSRHLLPAYAAMHWDLIRSTMPKGCILEVEVRLFAQSEYRMIPEYEATCLNYEISRLKNADFEGRPDLARKEINAYVKERTRNRITDLLPLGIIDRETKLLLVCAMYLRVQWYHPFEKKKTKSEPFYLPMKETMEVSYMHQINIFRWCVSNKLDCEVLELPFTNLHVRMYIYLPKKHDGLKKIEEKLNRTIIDNIEESLTETNVEVLLPRWRYELGFLPGDVVQKIGIKDLYTAGKCNLSALDGTKDLYLSRIFHHIHIEVDECGGDDMGNTSSRSTDGSSEPSEPKSFKCDHPFLYFIKDTRTGAMIVFGRVVRPAY